VTKHSLAASSLKSLPKSQSTRQVSGPLESDFQLEILILHLSHLELILTLRTLVDSGIIPMATLSYPTMNTLNILHLGKERMKF
jgi:hypothetical protein